MKEINLGDYVVTIEEYQYDILLERLNRINETDHIIIGENGLIATPDMTAKEKFDILNHVETMVIGSASEMSHDDEKLGNEWSTKIGSHINSMDSMANFFIKQENYERANRIIYDLITEIQAYTQRILQEEKTQSM